MSIQSHSCVVPAVPSGPQVFLQNSLTVALAFAPDTAFASFRLQIDGNAATESNNAPGFATQFVWLLSGVSGDYQVRMTMVSGPTFSGSAVGSWLALSGPQTWTTTRNTNGVSTSVGTLEIRRASDSVVLASCTVTLDVTREP
jgi:hypothetical protein